MAEGAAGPTAVESLLTLAELEARMATRPLTPGDLVRGRVVAVGASEVTLDVGGTRGTVPRAELGDAATPGSEVEVYVDEADAEAVRFSRHKAVRLGLWNWLASLRDSGETVEVEVISASRGDLAVDLGGIKATLPLRELAPGRRRDPAALLGTRLTVRVTHLREKKSQVVVSERAPIMADRAEARAQTLSTLEKGQVIEGEVVRLTKFGAFVDIGGVDGLLHVNDMSWRRINHPSEVVEVGDSVTVKVLDIDPTGEKIALGMKQTVPDPWLSAEQRYRPGTAVAGEVVGLTEFGAFVMLPDGIEGLVHVSEMAWGRQIKKPRDAVAKGDAVDAWVLRVDIEKRRLGLTMRDPAQNPWKTLAEKLPIGTRLESRVARVADFGVFVHLDEANDIAGLVHTSDFSWGAVTESPRALFRPGDAIEVMVLDIDPERGRAALGIKQLHEDLTAELIRKYEVGQTIEGRVTSVQDFGAFVELEPGIEGLVPAGRLAEERVEHPSAVVSPGQAVVVRVVSVDRDERKIGLTMAGLAQPGAADDAAGEGAPSAAAEPAEAAADAAAEAAEPVAAADAAAEAAEPEAAEVAEPEAVEAAADAAAEPEAAQAAEAEAAEAAGPEVAEPEAAATAAEPEVSAAEPEAAATAEPEATPVDASPAEAAEAAEPEAAHADPAADEAPAIRATDELPVTEQLPVTEPKDPEPGR
ncbi:MAG: S1 RNA-binding domain-containing protein [Myxococcales bacterium]|nr:S1 RNA-binding domain-containing protein [Myxococcales bacterium]